MHSRAVASPLVHLQQKIANKPSPRVPGKSTLRHSLEYKTALTQDNLFISNRDRSIGLVKGAEKSPQVKSELFRPFFIGKDQRYKS